jgi:hypothetical protein
MEASTTAISMKACRKFTSAIIASISRTAERISAGSALPTLSN